MAITLSLIVGRLRGGRLLSLGGLPLKGLVFIFGAFGLEAALNLASAAGWISAGPVSGLTHILVYVLVAWGLWANLDLPGIKWALCGSLLNAAVVVANGGRMPVREAGVIHVGLEGYLQSLREGEVITHFLEGDGTRLWFLGDVFAVPGNPIWVPPFVFSVGDFLIALALFVLVQHGMLHGRPRCPK